MKPLPFVLTILPLAIAWNILVAMEPRGCGYCTRLETVLRVINSREAEYAERCAAGGYAVDIADLEKPSGDGTFLRRYRPIADESRGGYVVRLARSNAPDVKPVGTAAKTCNGSTSQPESGYFVSLEPVELNRFHPYLATDERGTIWVSRWPIPNPIPASDGNVQPYEGGWSGEFVWEQDRRELELYSAIALIDILVGIIILLSRWRSAWRAALAFVLALAASLSLVPGTDRGGNGFDEPHGIVLLVLAFALPIVILVRGRAEGSSP